MFLQPPELLELIAQRRSAFQSLAAAERMRPSAHPLRRAAGAIHRVRALHHGVSDAELAHR